MEGCNDRNAMATNSGRCALNNGVNMKIRGGQPTRQRVQAPSWLAGVDLVLGGVNLHQDLHFSTFYLRASLASTTLTDYPGYTFVLAVYEDGVERYFIAADEAERTAKWLIDRCTSEPGWLEEKLVAIEACSERLAEAFPPGMTAESLRETATGDLLAIYRQHNSAHRELYRVARMPEALDRGLPYFSDYLRTYLRTAGVADADIPHVFEALTVPQTPSVIAQQETAFEGIVSDALVRCPEMATSHTPYMFLPDSIREALRLHREQWGWLCYHGFRNRALPTEHEYARRLVAALSARQSGAAAQKMAVPHPRPASSRFVASRIDRKHRELFRLYSEIGRVKLLRRYWQLRNFYFLDQLMAEFARRLKATEWQVRCCLPEELVAALLQGHLEPPVNERVQRCAVFYSAEGETVFGEADLPALMSSVSVRQNRNHDPAARQGTSACIGLARGRARIVGQSDDQMRAFQKGDVLVCAAADPDLLPVIRQAAAVVTQQGGVTSHASVLCREIGVPTVIGVEDLLSFVRDGEEIEVDATAGIVRLSARHQTVDRGGLIVPLESWGRPDRVGQKAANLQFAIKRGFKVPPYTLLSFEAMLKLLEEDEEALNRNLLNLGELLGAVVDDTPSFLLRSSAHDEDGARGSRTGAYSSVPLMMTTNPVHAVREFASRNQKLGYSGAVILQRFLPASICGVSIDGDQQADAEHRMIVELVRGPVNTVTDGRGQLQRFVYDYRSGEITAPASEGKAQQSILDSFPAGELVEWLSSAARAFGKPAYTEWGFFGGEYWLYQVRGAMLQAKMP